MLKMVTNEFSVLARLKESLLLIFREAITILPPDKIFTDPFEWLGPEMEEVIKILGKIRERVSKEVKSKEEEINRLVKDQKSLEDAIKSTGLDSEIKNKSDLSKNQDKSTSSPIWMTEQNLVLKQTLLLQRIKELELIYQNQKQEFNDLITQIKEVNTAIGQTQDQPILNHSGLIYHHNLQEAKTLLTQQQARLADLRAEAATKTKQSQINLSHLGIPFQDFKQTTSSLTSLEHALSQPNPNLTDLNTTLSTTTSSTTPNTSNLNTSTTSTNTSSNPNTTTPSNLNTTSTSSNTSTSTNTNTTSTTSTSTNTNTNTTSTSSNTNLILTPAEATCLLHQTSRVQRLAQQIEAKLQTRIQLLRERVPETTLPPPSSTLLQSIVQLSQAINAAEHLYKARITTIYQDSITRIQKYADQLQEIVQQPIPVSTYPDVNDLPFTEQEQLLIKVEQAATELEKEYTILRDIKAFIREREELLVKMSAFEEQASDPQRLFRSSFQLISEEKFRKMAVPTLLRVEKEIFSLAQEYTTRFNRPVSINNQLIVNDLQVQISHRIINSNVFLTARPKTR
ncbi:hypothetical protein NEHOM01_0494 [Nematocida homosporus]|uniref:uncharacterized protein n=1 Tax=Nematocida homosporus TaxID=1912981 RepID=UPI00221F4C45|nr:uncharacterized protein NEHOM01_0494 [Nematocida homosporus]KAI5184943.1 hypothetical protein NEHOM01_0494 [Nematocida homosporus]